MKRDWFGLIGAGFASVTISWSAGCRTQIPTGIDAPRIVSEKSRSESCEASSAACALPEPVPTSKASATPQSPRSILGMGDDEEIWPNASDVGSATMVVRKADANMPCPDSVLGILRLDGSFCPGVGGSGADLEAAMVAEVISLVKKAAAP